jgi:hypothetical protein
MSGDSLTSLPDEDHARIDQAWQRVDATRDQGTQEVLDAYEQLIAELTRHLFAMEVVLLPVAAQQLGRGTRELATQVTRMRQLEAIQQLIDERLRGWGDPPEAVEGFRRQLSELTADHRLAEERILSELDAALTGDERSRLAERLRFAMLHAPTRPHPHAIRRIVVTGWLYRVVAVWDKVLDVMDSRVVPPLRSVPRRAVDSLLDGYILGRSVGKWR